MAKISAIHIPAELKNLAINGALDFWQEKAATTTTINTASTTTTKFADMFLAGSQGATTKNYSLVRSTDVPSLAQSGFQSPFSALFTVLTGFTRVTSDLIQPFYYIMEGVDYAKIHSKLATFGFWFKTSTAGTYSFALGNAAGNRSYVTTFSASAATWEYKTITAQLDNTGTWNFDTGAGLLVYIASVSGSTFSTSATEQWQAGFLNCAVGATGWQATTGATLQIAQFSVLEGTLGLGAIGFARQGKSIQQELALCQRYYEKSYDVDVAPGTVTSAGSIFTFSNAATSYSFPITFKNQKRTTPTVTIYNPVTGGAGTTRGADGGNQAALPNLQGTWGASLDNNASNTASIRYQAHYTADARL